MHYASGMHISELERLASFDLQGLINLLEDAELGEVAEELQNFNSPLLFKR